VADGDSTRARKAPTPEPRKRPPGDGRAASTASAGTFAAAVRERRVAVRLTQEQLAAQAGLSVRSLSAIERGRVRYPRAESARLIGRALGLAGTELAAFEALARAEYWDDRGPPLATVAVSAPGPDHPLVRPAQLPPDIAGFVGRIDALAELDALLERDNDGYRTALPVAVVAGTAGVGKTAFAVHWAHRNRPAFPDGELYVDLRGFEPATRPAPPGWALRGFLDALAVPPARVPSTLDGQVALYRSLLDHRRMLILLDNAADVAQVRPLLPGSPSCLVVVTSRDRLAGLVASHAARPIALAVLDPATARELVATRIGSARAAAEPDAVEEILRRCAFLPLALSVVAARAATHPALALGTLAVELRQPRRGLDGADNDPATDVRTVFSSSYRALGGPARFLFRLLSLHPGPFLGEVVAARLAGLSVPQIRPAIADLIRAHLVTEDAPGRYGLHDLLRAYAAEVADAEDRPEIRTAAVARMLRYYLGAVRAAAVHFSGRLLPLPDSITDAPVDEPPGDRATAMAWFADEQPVLVAAVHIAAESGDDRTAVHIAEPTARYLQNAGRWADQTDLMRTGVEAAVRLGDSAALIHCRTLLAQAYILLGQYDQAHVELRDAIDVAVRDHDHLLLAQVRMTVAAAYERQGRHGDAIGESRRALASLPPSRPELRWAARNTIAWQHALLGEQDEAIAQSRAVLDESGSRPSPVAAAALHTLGYAEHRAGRPEAGRVHLERSAAMYRQLANSYLEAATLDHAAAAMLDAGDADAARRAWQRALTAYEELGHPAADGLRARLLGPG
jgi:transcriptional regulator with XRE-family HTH domain/tetratricopeptide (TPR) repeat protein